MKSTRVLFVLASAIVSSSCRSTSAGTSAREHGEASLASKLEILNPRIEGDGPTRALVVVLSNTTGELVATGLAVDWFDAAGRHLPLQTTAWIPLMVEGHESTAVRVAPMPVEARSWRLRFSSPN